MSYHYYICCDGEIIPTLLESVQGVHARHYNHCSLGICYEEGYDEKEHVADTRAQAQKATMYALLKELREEYLDARIIGHCELPHVVIDCPCIIASTYYRDLRP